MVKKSTTKKESAEAGISTLTPGKPDGDTQYTPYVSHNDVIVRCTEKYLNSLLILIENGEAQIKDSSTDDYVHVEAELLNATNIGVKEWNNFCGDGRKMKVLNNLTDYQIAQILIKLHHATRVALAGLTHKTIYDALCVYDDDETSLNYGVYVSDPDDINPFITHYCPSIKKNERECVWAKLRDCTLLEGLRVAATDDPDLVPLNNGIFNYTTKELLPFSDNYVFLSKSHVNYVKDAPNPGIMNPDGSTWDVEQFFVSLAPDDPEMVDALWKATGSTLRPNVSWDRAYILYSEKGSNGKGTLCQVQSDLVGESSVCPLGISDFSKGKFALDTLPGTQVNICDENHVKDYVKDLRAYKAAITGDLLTIEKKFQNKFSFRWHGVSWQCTNDLIRTQDTTESFYRRLLMFHFKQTFKGESENKAIKDDYLRRPEVLEYIVFKVLTVIPDYYAVPEPQSCKELKEEYKEKSNPVRQFADELFSGATFNWFSSDLVYFMYRNWYKKYVSERKDCLDQKNLVNQLKTILDEGLYPNWEYKQTTHVYAEHLNGSGIAGEALYEPLLVEWCGFDGHFTADCGDYRIERYKGGKKPRGFMRINTEANQNNNDSEEE